MEFDLLIPDDDRPIEERTQALTAWCSGFLYGLGSNGAADPQRLPGDLGEIVRDLTEITRADVDASDSVEANESALAELVEFVRVGVQLVFDELEPLRERHTAPRPGAALMRACRAAFDLNCRLHHAPALLFSSEADMAEPSKVEFARRRRALMRLMGRDAIAMVPSAPVRQRNNDVEYNYRQDSDFYYLTGFNEPEAVAVLIPGREAAEYVLFVRERNREREIWDGKRAGPDGAVEEYGADDAFPITDIDEILPGLLESRAARVLHHGPEPGIRSARDRLGQHAARAGAQRDAPAAGIRGARSRAA